MQKKDIFRLGLLTTALTLSQGVWALGLGRLTVQSALGQSLNAQIELMGTKDEFSELTANIAAPALYQEKDLVYQAALARTKVTLERRADGSAFLKIVSTQPVTEPYIDLLVEVNWPAGHALREYTVLLDPPIAGKPEPMMPAQQATVGGRTAARAAAAETAPSTTTTAAAPSRARPRPTPTRAAGAATAGGAGMAGDTYEVQRGDTLSGIAQTYKTDEITLNQALAALYESNPSAFIGKNINRLRSGVILQIPDKETMAATEVDKANRLVRVQVAEWRSYLEQVAGQPAPVRSGAGTTTAEGAITPTPTVVEGAKQGQDQLVVSAGSGQQGGRGQAAGNAAAEDRVAMAKALEEEKSRVKELEETVKKLQRAMELKNQDLAQLQRQAQMAAEGKGATEGKDTVVAVAEPVKPAEPVPAEDGQAKPAEPTPITAAGGGDSSVAAASEPAPPEPQPKPQPQPKPRVRPVPPPPPPQPTFFETVLETVTSNLPWIGGALALILAGLGFLMYRRRRAEEEVIDSMFGATTTGGTVAPSSFGSATASGTIDTRSSNTTAGSNSILSEFSREGLGSIDTGEVDPLAEADVYLAYGRAQQAEEILQDALKRGPDRQDVFLKLLEVYADQKKTTEFEAAATQLHALTQGKGEYWQRAAVLGQRLLPGNGLFAGAAGLMTDGEFTHTNTATEPMQVGGQAVDPRGFAPMESKSIAERAADIASRAVEARGEPQSRKQDFSFGTEGALAQDDIGVDLDLEELSRFRNYGKAEEQVDIGKPQPDIDFDLDDFDSPPQIDDEKMPARRPPSLAELDFSDNDSVVGGEPLPPVLDGQWHDAATKLDLARAYQATGDTEACREILQEVLQEGDDQQKAEAKAILQSLS